MLISRGFLTYIFPRTNYYTVPGFLGILAPPQEFSFFLVHTLKVVTNEKGEASGAVLTIRW